MRDILGPRKYHSEENISDVSVIAIVDRYQRSAEPSMSVSDMILVNAHNEIVQEYFDKLVRFMPDGNMSGLNVGLNSIYGLEEGSNSHANGSTLFVPMELVWQMLISYVADVNRVLASSEASSSLRIYSSVSLPLPRSLFDLDAPVKVVNLINGTNLSNRSLGIKTLLLVGNVDQAGSSPIQFFNIIHELGKSVRDGQSQTDIELGIGALRNIKNSMNHNLSKTIDQIIDQINFYQSGFGVKIYDDLSSYIAYLSGDKIPPVEVFIAGNANVDLIVFGLEIVKNNKIDISKYWLSRLQFNPKYQEVVKILMNHQEFVHPRSKEALGAMLIRTAAWVRDYKMIEIVMSEYLSSRSRDSELDRERSDGVKVLSRGLALNNAEGLNRLLSDDLSILEKLIVIDSSEVERISYAKLFMREDKHGNAVIQKLALQGEHKTLEKLLHIIPLSIQQELLNQVQSNSDGYTALHLAVRNGHEEVVRLLLSCMDGYYVFMVDTDICDKGGYTALMYAVLLGKSNFVDMLLESGADPEIQQDNGCSFTAMYWAVEKKNEEILKLLSDEICSRRNSEFRGSREQIEETEIVLTLLQEPSSFHREVTVARDAKIMDHMR